MLRLSPDQNLHHLFSRAILLPMAGVGRAWAILFFLAISALGASARGAGYTTLYRFAGGSNDGAHPDGSLIQSGSILYGTTRNGGVSDNGTLFQYDTTTNTETLLYRIGMAPGSWPYCTLVQSGSN